MSVGRVATFSFAGEMLQQALASQSRVANLQLQQSSGMISTDYGGLGATAGNVVDLESYINRTNSYVTATTAASNRVDVMYSSFTSMTDLLTSFKSTLSQASIESDPTTLAQAAASDRDQLINLLNTQYAGRYLFGGAVTNEKPVQLDTTAYDMSNLTSEQTDYYKGDTSASTVQVSSTASVSYSVTAADSGFEQALRVFSSFANITSDTLTSTNLSDGMTLLTSAMDGILGSQAQISNASSNLKAASESQTGFISTAKEMLSSYKDVDLAAVTAQVSTSQTQLESSYMALSKISSVSLLKYLS